MIVSAASGEKLEAVFAGNSTEIRPDICLFRRWNQSTPFLGGEYTMKKRRNISKYVTRFQPSLPGRTPSRSANPALKRRASGSRPLRGLLLYCPAQWVHHAVIDEHPFCGESPEPCRASAAVLVRAIAMGLCPAWTGQSPIPTSYCGFFFPNSPPKGLFLPPGINPLS